MTSTSTGATYAVLRSGGVIGSSLPASSTPQSSSVLQLLYSDRSVHIPDLRTTRLEARLPDGTTTTMHRVRSRGSSDLVLCGNNMAKPSMIGIARNNIRVTVDGAVKMFYIHGKSSAVAGGVTPIACTCADWYYRGVQGLGAPGQHSVNFSQFHRIQLTPRGCMMGAQEGCKHMRAVPQQL